MPLSEISGKSKTGFGSARLLHRDPSVSARHKPAARQHPWKVVHACEFAREILPLVEGQVAVGMRPLLLTPGGFGAAGIFKENHKRQGLLPVSLLQTWNHVREWRKLLNESAAESACEVIHAHSFSAGMAAVRNSSGVVYRLKRPIEKLAAESGHCADGSWLARSFRVAEQFVLARAAAVVVGDNAGRLACFERGARAESLFLIPEPVSSDLLDSEPDREWLNEISGGRGEMVFFLIPGLAASSAWEMRESLLRWMRVLSVVRRENPDVLFLFLAEPNAASAIHEIALACNLMSWVKVLATEDRDRAVASADVIICDREHAATSFALEALGRGRALLAADVEQHREISSDGRGCLWFRAGEVSDIAYRAGFLATNPQFRRALGVAAREHCIATRGGEVIGAQYDRVYRLAFSKRKGQDSSTPKPHLVPLHVQN